MKPRPPLAIAHRGVHSEYPENSLPAIAAALESGADGIEIDVHATQDGVLVVHHDPDLKDGRAISQLTSKEFASVELEHGVRVPFLEEVLDLLAGNAILFIETKAEGVELPLIRAVRRSSAESAVHSFHHDTIRNLKHTMPALRCGILTSGSTGAAIAAARRVNADDVWHESRDVDAALTNECHRLGKQVIAWTANSKKECDRLTTLRVDGICTDDLSLLSAVAR